MRINILILALLALLAVSRVSDWMRSPGIDFYQFWGIGKAPGWTTQELGNPYANSASYLGVLDNRLAMTTNVRLQEARKVRNKLDVTGTPLLYTLFTVLPDDYGLAFALYQIGQLLAFLVAMYLVACMFPSDRWGIGVLTLVAILAYQPLAGDVRLGNVNTLQLAVFAGIAFAAGRSEGRRDLAPLLCMGALTTMILVKPNLIVAAVFLAVHVLARYGVRRFALALIPSTILGVLLIAIASNRYGGWTAWSDWFATVAGTDRARLIYPVALGNSGTGPVVANVLGVDPWLVIAALAVLLAGSAVSALAARDGASAELERGVPRDRAVRVARDPWLMLSAGIVASIALSPLVWNHYYLVTLLPALWLMLSPARHRLVQQLAALSILLSSGAFPAALRLLGLKPFSPYVATISWMPLWIGLLLVGAGARHEMPPVVAAGAGPRRGEEPGS